MLIWRKGEGYWMKLDHVVYFTEKTPIEVVEAQGKLGWHTVVGGSHKKWGTCNALMYVNNAYVEWLALENEEIATASDNPLIQLYLHDIKDNEGWGTICCSVDGIAHFNEQLIEKGYSTSGVLNAERLTTQGDLRKWKMLFIKQEPTNALPYPFFIEWEMEEEERVADLRMNGTLSKENERLEVTDCLFYVADAQRTAAEWAKLLELEQVEDTVLHLPNCQLKFIEGMNENLKERLADVSIQNRL